MRTTLVHQTFTSLCTTLLHWSWQQVHVSNTASQHHQNECKPVALDVNLTRMCTTLLHQTFTSLQWVQVQRDHLNITRMSANLLHLMSTSLECTHYRYLYRYLWYSCCICYYDTNTGRKAHCIIQWTCLVGLRPTGMEKVAGDLSSILLHLI